MKQSYSPKVTAVQEGIFREVQLMPCLHYSVPIPHSFHPVFIHLLQVTSFPSGLFLLYYLCTNEQIYVHILDIPFFLKLRIVL